MTEIYLIRHAQAEGNVYRMMQGHWDGDVTDMGMRQIDALAERFKDVAVDAIYASDLYRTRLTASAISRYHDLPIIPRKDLREINVGPWETRFFGNVIHDEPETAYNFMYDQNKWYKEGAETYADVTNRVYPALVDIAQKHPGGKVVAVSHGVSIRCAVAKIAGLDLNDVEGLPICRNTSVTKLIWDKGKFTLAYMNDYSHLEALGSSPWNANSDLRDEPVDVSRCAQWYMDCYEDCWLAAHGSTGGFNGPAYLNSAIEHYKADPESILRIYDKDEPVGLIDMDTSRGAQEGYGWISLLYLKEEYRRKGYGIQLLARPMFKYTAMGRKALRLHAAVDNKAAIAFYEKYGFETIAVENGRLLLMEKKLGGFRNEK